MGVEERTRDDQYARLDAAKSRTGDAWKTFETLPGAPGAANIAAPAAGQTKNEGRSRKGAACYLSPSDLSRPGAGSRCPAKPDRLNPP